MFPNRFTLDIATAPVIGVLFLLATRSINGESVRNGIVGAPSSGVEPYAVMILFFSLAYICISLDMTGVFQYAAFWISKRGGGGGQRVFLSFFLLSTVMSGLTSNDVVVLTMTPFLVYYSHAVDLVTPVAFLMAEIQTANIASMALYIGNLTNVVACQAYKISFLEYSAWMLLPCFASIIACYVMLRINFRHEKYIPKVIKNPDVDPRSCLVDPIGAIFGLSVLACSLICLIGTSFAHVSVWIVTGPFALLTLSRDIWYDSQGKFKGPQAASPVSRGDRVVDENPGAGGDASRVEQGLPTVSVPEKSIVRPISIGEGPELATIVPSSQVSIGSSSDSEKEEHACAVMDEKHGIPAPLPATASTPSASSAAPQRQPQKSVGLFERKFPLLHAIAIRMPWAILPFTFSMFIMVEGLSDSGWIAIFANWATKLVPNYIAATYAIGFISVLLCNIFNNVPMTILVARILQHPNFVSSPMATPEVVKGCLFALIVGSNLGACTTLISSLAGLMWDSVLRNKNRGVGFWNFFRWNMGVMPVVIFVALSVVVVELTVIY
ncbi:hypothetical protein BGZ99_009641 [Dissophora globulifera]|uniref:Citrate transporter-like domain-containing protein n=1 Tax=Dissophora globulifera TaxID=979702 RepID=A0A9P6R427_9FUNG|nr:hypothetical protein BGZ99_009641 [Dissophora globulifera]